MLKSWGGLRAKIIAWFLIPTAVILSAVAGLTFYASRQVTEELVFDRSLDRTQVLALQLSADLEQYRVPLGTLTASYDVVSGDVPGLSAERLASLLWAQWPVGALSVFDGGVLALDATGEVVAAATHTPAVPMVGRVYPTLTAAKGATDAWGFSGVVRDLLGEDDAIALSLAFNPSLGVREGVGTVDTLVGLFRAERGATRTSEFYRNIWSLYIGRRETAYLVDGAGVLIFHPDTFLIGDDARGWAPVAQALRGGEEPGVLRARNGDGQAVVAGYAPVPRTDWFLVTETLWDEVVQESRSYTRLMVVLLALGVIVPSAVVVLGVGRITRPLTRLTRAAQEVAGGHFDQAIEVHTGDEVETLAEQFNIMAEELAASYANLEQRVADRTRELAALNAITTVVSRSLALKEVMQAALEKTLEVMGLDAGAAFTLEIAATDDGGPDEEVLCLIAHAGLSADFVARIGTLPRRESVAGDLVVRSGIDAPVVRRVADYPAGAIKRVLEQEGFDTVVCVPLVAKGTLLGVLNLASLSPRVLTPEARSLLAAVGQQAGVAVENARLYAQAEVTAATEERNRLARELHDAVSQTLFTASLVAQVIPELWKRDPEEAQRQLAALQRLTRGAMAEMRTLLLELRPSALTEATLDTLLRQLAQAAVARLDAALRLDLAPAPALPVEVKLALYRIVQEALNNVVKHADPNQVVVGLRAPEDGDGVTMWVQDDGRGFDISAAPPDHFGLSNMRERAESIGARYEIVSAPGVGTQVTVTWLLKEA